MAKPDMLLEKKFAKSDILRRFYQEFVLFTHMYKPIIRESSICREIFW